MRAVRARTWRRKAGRGEARLPLTSSDAGLGGGRGPVERDRAGLALEGVVRARRQRDVELVAVLLVGGEAAEADRADAADLGAVGAHGRRAGRAARGRRVVVREGAAVDDLDVE